MTMRWAIPMIVACAPMFVYAEPPAGVLDAISGAAQALANGDARQFLDHFDKNMADYAALRERVEGLLSAYEAGSTVEIVTDQGDERKYTLDLDWMLLLNERNAANVQRATRRKLIQCTVERRGRDWKITAIAPLDFFAK